MTARTTGASPAAAGKTTMDKETDAKMFAAALYVITDMWGKEMGDLQRASLANQIVREIERRGIIQPAAAAEAPSAERVRNNPAPPVQMEAVAPFGYWIEDGVENGFQLGPQPPGNAAILEQHGIKVTPLYDSPVPSSERYPDWSKLHQKIADKQVFLAKGTIEHDGRLAVVDREFMQSAWSALWDLQRAAYAPDGVPSSERDEIGNGWVKRSERLPTVGGTYLVGAYDDTTPLPRTFVRFWASFFLFDAGPEWQILDAEHEHRTVEYWIDLPPHPEHPGRKPAVRADRDDIIEMCARTEPTKYDLVPGRYQKRTLIKRISYVLTGGQFGIEPGYVVLGLSDPEVTP